MIDDRPNARQKKSLNVNTYPPDKIKIDDKVRFLSSRSSYPDRPEIVGVEETHMSWIFLAGKFVYKLKKPVKYSFLDFSTLELREANCRNEVRLNLRLAPDIYLGVTRLTLKENGELAIDGSGATIDWLVKMHRLPAEQMLDISILSGKVEHKQVETLANLLVKFYNNAEHAEISPETYIQGFQYEHQLNRSILENPIFDLDDARVRKILGDVDEFVHDEGDLLRERVLKGRIVDGHGDLKPEHICLLAPPVIIDCLEFNKSLRLVDPFDDLAFLCLECQRLGAYWIGDLLVQHCAIRLTDGPIDRLFAFYKIFRACLRARLALAHLLEPNPSEHGKWLLRAKQYLDIAEETNISLIPQGVQQSIPLHGNTGSPQQRGGRR